uniref:5-formyltetrahydrofolate cyclo-ligase n=1 Tax=Heterorhabditis bacteriophora TaxID=37862 RepID=A0A1I7XC50_HETBA
MDRIIHRLSESNCRLTAKDIHNKIKAYPECSLYEEAPRFLEKPEGLPCIYARKPDKVNSGLD